MVIGNGPVGSADDEVGEAGAWATDVAVSAVAAAVA
jgi:hypothetical protein